MEFEYKPQRNGRQIVEDVAKLAVVVVSVAAAVALAAFLAKGAR